MSDDRSNRGSPDRDRINVNQEHEVRYWSTRLGVTADQLKEAVREVGPTAKAVEERLRTRH